MKKGKIFYGWWIVLAALLITSTMVPSVVALANKFLIPVTEDMGISRSTFTLSNTVLQAMGIFLSPFVAKNLSKGNMKRIQSISIVGFALAYASYGLAQKPIHHYMSSFVLGICFLNAAIIPISLMITNWFVKKRGLAMSIAMAGIGVGGFIFSPLLTKWMAVYGWRTTYMIFAAIILVVSLPMALFVFKKKPEDMGLKPYGADEVVKSNAKLTQTVKLTTKAAFVKPFFLIMILGMVLNGVINSGALGQFPPALEGMHGASVAATIISLYSIVGVVGKLLLGWINDRWGIVASTIFGCSTFATAFIFMLFGKNMLAVYGMAIVFGLGIAIGSVSPPLVTSSIFGAKQYGEVYGYVSSATQIGMSIGSLIVASIYDSSGSYDTAWMILFVLTIAAMLSWITAYKQSRKFCGEDSVIGEVTAKSEI